MRHAGGRPSFLLRGCALILLAPAIFAGPKADADDDQFARAFQGSQPPERTFTSSILNSSFNTQTTFGWQPPTRPMALTFLGAASSSPVRAVEQNYASFDPKPNQAVQRGLETASPWVRPLKDTRKRRTKEETVPPVTMAFPDERPLKLASFEAIEGDVPSPVFLDDDYEGCNTGGGSGVSPIFESTVSSFGGVDRLSSLAPPGPIGGTNILRPTGRHSANFLHDPNCQGQCDVCNPCSPWFKVFRSFCSGPTCDEGIGHERIMFAPFEIEVPLPANYVAFRYDAADGLRFPDRAEVFWARQPAPGPARNARRVDYQDLKFVMSLGGDRFSTVTEIPLRFIDVTSGSPAFGNDSTGGLGDISIATKLLLIDGQHWKITQYFKTTLQTGSVSRGLSNGNIALEPGLLAQYKWSPSRYWFGEMRYWFPTNADPSHGGTLLRYSLGTSKLWYETDTFAAMRTLEFVGTSVLTGAKSAPDLTEINVDGEHSLAILPGLRFVLGPAGDLGLFELGVQAGMATNNRGFYSSLSRLELRFNF